MITKGRLLEQFNWAMYEINNNWFIRDMGDDLKKIIEDKANKLPDIDSAKRDSFDYLIKSLRHKNFDNEFIDILSEAITEILKKNTKNWRQMVKDELSMGGKVFSRNSSMTAEIGILNISLLDKFSNTENIPTKTKFIYYSVNYEENTMKTHKYVSNINEAITIIANNLEAFLPMCFELTNKCYAE